MELESSGFTNGGRIPDNYARSGKDLSPPLAWRGEPSGTRTFALIVDDPDAPSGTFVHWLIYNIPSSIHKLDPGVPVAKRLSGGTLQGRNGFGRDGYDGPQPPSGVHRYFFHLYAVDSEIKAPPGASREQVDDALRGHVLAECRLIGKYQHR